MITLGWQSLEVLRAALDWEELNTRCSYAMVQALFQLHSSNAALFVRWDLEWRSLIEQRKQMRHQQEEVFFEALVGNNCEFADLEKKRPELSTKKEELEIELLRLSQHENTCLRAKCAADRYPRGSLEAISLRESIERVCEAFNAQHERCVSLIDQFRHDYLAPAG